MRFLHQATLLIGLLFAATVAAAPKPLKVFILAGQSNMDGQANVSTIDFLGEDKENGFLLKKFKPDGKTLVTRDDVWVAHRGVYGKLAPGYGGRKSDDKLGNNIGPEYAFGYFMGEALEEQVLLIKYATGGQSLYQNFRPPSAGLPSPLPSKTKEEDFGNQYRGLVAYVHETLDNLKKHFPAYDEKAGYEIAGFVWFQGYNDLFVPDKDRKDYGRYLVCLIHDLRKEFKAPEMKVVVGVMGVNGVKNEVGKQKEVRDGQRSVNSVPEFKGNVKAIETAPLLHPDVVAIKTAGWLNKERDLKNNPITPEEQAMLKRATSNQGYHYYGEGRFFILLGKSFAETMLELMKIVPPKLQAGETKAEDVETAIKTGDFAGYLANATARLNQTVSANTPGEITETTLENLLTEPSFAYVLAQRQLISKTGADNLGDFAKADPANQTFLAWLLKNTPGMDLYLEAAVPVGIAAREQNQYTLSVGTLEIWKKILNADPHASEGLPLRLAIATALRPPGTGAPGAGQQKPPSGPVMRYQYFKKAWQNKELFPSFDHLTVWEYQFVVSAGASEADLTWAREMINTWRPDLRINEQVVNSTGEVKYGKPLHPFTDYKSVLCAGGQCGPRSSWSVMICQAFGIPAIGVGQPGHACVAYKAANPMIEPQPGSAWKVAYGRGWQVSKLEGMAGPEFLAGVEERQRVAEFSRVEHLRWLASALTSAEQAAAVMRVARKIQSLADGHSAIKTDITASAKADEAEKELQPAKVTTAPAANLKAPVKLGLGTTRVEAAAFANQSGVRILDCFTGGKQVNFQKNMQSSWLDYTVDVPAAGIYGVEVRIATPNLEQALDISSGTNKLSTIKVPNTTGLWGTTPAVDIRLDQGVQTLRISAPFQRGMAIRWFELRAKG